MRLAYLAGVVLTVAPETDWASYQALVVVVEVCDSTGVSAFLAVQGRSVAQHAAVMTGRALKTREYFVIASRAVRHARVHIPHLVVRHRCVVDPASSAGVVTGAKT